MEHNPARGFFILFLSAVTGAVLIGGIYHLVARWFEMFLIFPAFAGVSLGFIMSAAIKKEKIRNITIIILVSLIAGTITYGCKNIFDSIQARPEMIASLSEYLAERDGVTIQEAKAWVEPRITPLRTLQIWWDWQADYGITIGDEMSDFIIAGRWYYLLLIIETFLIAGLSMSLPLKTASAPFCEKCNEWASRSNIFRLHPSQSDVLVEKVRARKWKEMYSQSPEGAITNDSYCDLDIIRCDICKEVEIVVKTKTGGKRAFDAYRATISEQTLSELIDSAPQFSE